ASQDLAFPGVPSLGLLAIGAAAGVAVAWVLARVGLPSYLPAVPSAALVLAVVAGALSVANHGFARRQGGATWLASSGVVTWAADQPAWRSGRWPIAFAPQVVATLAGDRLQHPIGLIGQRESCASVAGR